MSVPTLAAVSSFLPLAVLMSLLKPVFLFETIKTKNTMHLVIWESTQIFLEYAVWKKSSELTVLYDTH